jgi:hypothetical protein
VHAERIEQLKTDEGARDRLARRELVRAFAQAGKTTRASKLEPVKPGLRASPATIRRLVAEGKAAQLPLHRGNVLTTGLHTSIGTVVVRPALKAVASVTPKGVAKNALSDAAELAVTTPSSLAKFGATAATHPGQALHMVTDPYKQLAKDPGKFIHDRPVTALLMATPAAVVPGRIAGKGLRLAGKQTLAREPKTLPGTPLKETRTKSRDALVNYVQTRRDRKAGSRTMTVGAEPSRSPGVTATAEAVGVKHSLRHPLAGHISDVQRRVDAFYDFARKHKQRVTSAAEKQAKELPEEKRAEHVSGARAGAEDQVKRKFAEEFGVTARLAPASGLPRKLYHGSPHGPEKVMQGGLRPSRSPDAPTIETARHGVHLSTDPRTARIYGRHLYEVDEKALRDLSPDPSGPGAMHTPHAIPAEALRYAGRAGDFDEKLITALERKGEQPKEAPRAILKPKQADKGALHESAADARAIADRINADPKRLYDVVVREAGHGKWAVLPKVAAQRLKRHEAVGSSPAIGAKVMRTGGRLFRGAVIPTSMGWLAGQAGEAGLRSAVAGAGPLSLIREHRVVKAMNEQVPGSGTEFRLRAGSSGQFGLTGTAREFAEGGKTLGGEFAGTVFQGPTAAATKLGATKPMQHVRRGWKHYTHAVFNIVNGAIEQTAQRAMAGKAIKQSPLMERRLFTLSDKAIHEAAQGLHGTHTQVQLGRDIHRMYGKYSGFSPDMRETLLHTTPFYPWYRNVVTFLTKTLPVDHPVKTALIADLDAATEDWRKAHGLSLRGGETRPGFLLGGYPVGSGDQVRRVGRFTPFAPADPLQAVADLGLPQFSGVRDALRGFDWAGKKLQHPDGKPFSLPEKLAYALATEVGVLAPGAGPVGRVTGLQQRYIEHKDEKSVLQGKPLGPALGKQFNPLKATAAPKAQRKSKSGGSRGGVNWGGGSSGPKRRSGGGGVNW